MSVSKPRFCDETVYVDDTGFANKIRPQQSAMGGGASAHTQEEKKAGEAAAAMSQAMAIAGP